MDVLELNNPLVFVLRVRVLTMCICLLFEKHHIVMTSIPPSNPSITSNDDSNITNTNMHTTQPRPAIAHPALADATTRPAANKKFLTKKELLFQDKLIELKQFGNQYGHLQVPKHYNKQLFNWIKNLRTCESDHKENRRRKHPLTPVQQAELTQIGFHFNVNLPLTTKYFRIILFNISDFKQQNNGHADFYREGASHELLTLFQIAHSHLVQHQKSIGKARRKQLDDLGIVLEEPTPVALNYHTAAAPPASASDASEVVDEASTEVESSDAQEHLLEILPTAASPNPPPPSASASPRVVEDDEASTEVESSAPDPQQLILLLSTASSNPPLQQPPAVNDSFLINTDGNFGSSSSGPSSTQTIESNLRSCLTSMAISDSAVGVKKKNQPKQKQKKSTEKRKKDSRNTKASQPAEPSRRSNRSRKQSTKLSS